MNRKRILWSFGIIMILLATTLTACGGKTPAATPAPGNNSGDGGNGEEMTVEPTVAPEDLFPEILILHPDATDIVVTEATNTYVYIVPMMVEETMTYLQTELEARGWEALGNPSMMGHLATVVMQHDEYRANISLQDNERSMTTRVQISLIDQ